MSWSSGRLVAAAVAALCLWSSRVVAQDSRAPALQVQAGLFSFARDLSFNDDLSGLASYELGPAAAVRAALRWYPGAHLTDGVLAHLGLGLEGTTSVALDTVDAEGVTLSSQMTGLFVGALARLPVAEHLLCAAVGYELHDFEVAQGDSFARNRVPSMAYRLFRMALDGQLALGQDWELQLAAAWLSVMNSGPFGQGWFPHAEGDGIDLSGGLRYALSQSIGLELGLGLRRYFMDLQPQVGEEYEGLPIAGGAVDQYLRIELGVSGRWAG